MEPPFSAPRLTIMRFLAVFCCATRALMFCKLTDSLLKKETAPFRRGLIYSHDTIDILLCIARHLFIPRQFPVFQSANSGNTVSRGSRLKLSAVLS
jgi:hypothetical protein